MFATDKVAKYGELLIRELYNYVEDNYFDENLAKLSDEILYLEDALDNYVHYTDVYRFLDLIDSLNDLDTELTNLHSNNYVEYYDYKLWRIIEKIIDDNEEYIDDTLERLEEEGEL